MTAMRDVYKWKERREMDREAADDESVAVPDIGGNVDYAMAQLVLGELFHVTL